MKLDILVNEIKHNDEILEDERPLSINDLMDSFEGMEEADRKELLSKLDKEVLQKLEEGGII